MHLFELIAEQKIADAIARGEFDDLPGQGKPLDLEDDALIPEESRLAWRILRNAGIIPAELQSIREIAELERLLEADVDISDLARSAAVRKLHLLRLARDEARSPRNGLGTRGYLDKILRRLA